MHIQWLFWKDVFLHWWFAMSALSVAFTISEYIRKKALKVMPYLVIAALVLIFAFDMAWRDEHRNSEVLISQKRSAVELMNYWKGQSYQKDAALRRIMGLLAKTSSALAGAQDSENKTQASLAKLSSKILDFEKPVAQKFTVGSIGWNLKGKTWPNYAYTIVMSNALAQAHFRISCDAPWQVIDASILNGGPHFPNAVAEMSPTEWEINIPSPSMGPNRPLVITEGLQHPGNCQIHSEQ